jgi:regulator of protease activity HflC (stomatin/prohibitin superfamily)
MPSNLLPGLLRRFQRESPPISPRNGAEIPTPEPPLSPDSGSSRDPYRAAVLVLLAASLLGAAGAIAGLKWIANPVLLDVAVTLGIAAGVLIGVAFAQTVRVRLPKKIKEIREPDLALPPEPLPDTRIRYFKAISQVRARLRVFGVITAPIWQWLRNAEEELVLIRVAIAPLGLAAIIYVLTQNTVLLPKAPATSALPPVPPALWIGAALLLIAAGLAAVTVSYLAEIEPARFPEASGLRQGTRVAAWILLLAAASMGLLWARQYSTLVVLHYVILAVDATVCFSLLTVKPSKSPGTFPLNLGVLSVLGSRANVLGSSLDSGERQLGIDLRSTWAVAVVRRGVEPLIICLCLLGWLSTSLTVVGVQEQGLVERLGKPVAGPPLEPGIHVHWPWPVDTVFRLPMHRVQALEVGHEGVERAGPENVLWAVAHAANEYTLLLGNGRDLITVDAAVQYRIVDARAWRYHCQNPADALRAIAYRAVMRSTVDLTLSDALSENVTTLTGQMRDMVQKEADALGLGVQVIAFTVGGMHPPVQVASAYEAVVSAQVAKVTAVVNAQAFRNQTVPAAEASVLESENTAQADGAQALALAAGQAWSFRTLESQYRVDPQEYYFRRRLELLEKDLSRHRFTVVDSRFLRDGGEIWATR